MGKEVVRVAVFWLPSEAMRAVEELRDAGIPAFLSGEETAGAFAGNAGIGPQLAVFTSGEEMKRVRDILGSLSQTSALLDDGAAGDEIEDLMWVCSCCDEPAEWTLAECPYCHTPRPQRAEEPPASDER